MIKVACERLNGRDVFEVPVTHPKGDGYSEPRCPISGWHAFYTRAEPRRCIVICSERVAKYLHHRSYARYLGEAVFSVDGIDHGKHPLTVAMLEGL